MDWPAFEPDFENLVHVLRGGVGWRVPTAELVIDTELLRPITTTH